MSEFIDISRFVGMLASKDTNLFSGTTLFLHPILENRGSLMKKQINRLLHSIRSDLSTYKFCDVTTLACCFVFAIKLTVSCIFFILNAYVTTY